LLGMKSMAIVHDVARLDQINERPKLSSIARVTDLLIAHNKFSETSLLAALGDTKAKVKVIPSGNYIAQFPNPPSRVAARQQLRLPDNQLIIMFFGNPRREKGLHVLLEAMITHRDSENLLLLVAGKMKPAEEAEHRAFVAKHGLEQRVRFDIGHVSDEAVPAYYRAADIVILPYLRIYESAIALMSMSLERPVIASDLPPLREVVADDCRGLLFPPENAVALAARIGEVLQDPSHIEALAKAASHYAAHERHWDVTGKMLSAAAQNL
jgi:D-inositol-3-phosphate glycosyltransferase